MDLPPLPSVGLSDDELFLLLFTISYGIAYRGTVWLFARWEIIEEYDPDNVEREEWIRIVIIATFAALLGSIVLYELMTLVV